MCQSVDQHLRRLFRQPAIGGQLGDSAQNDEASWQGLMGLAFYPQVFVKVSAHFRTSAEAPPFADLEPRVVQLLKAYSPSRLMWGSDYPFVLPGGFPLPEGITETAAAMDYTQAAKVPDRWTAPELDARARDALMGGTCAELFGFALAKQRASGSELADGDDALNCLVDHAVEVRRGELRGPKL